VTLEVEEAIREIKREFVEHQVDVTAEAQGGAYVVVHDLPIGDHYTPPTAWVGFLVDFQYPRSDIYPHFIDGSVQRADGRGHGTGFSGPTEWQGRWALQISRRTRPGQWNPAVDTAVTKLIKVLEWIKAQ
jgi:hypothetical protein